MLVAKIKMYKLKSSFTPQIWHLKMFILRNITIMKLLISRHHFHFFCLGEYFGDINMEKKNIEHHFQQIKQEQMRHLLDSLNVQERMRIDNMVDKHAQEMLQLIDKKARFKALHYLEVKNHFIQERSISHCSIFVFTIELLSFLRYQKGCHHPILLEKRNTNYTVVLKSLMK